jgi:hypothetical protein
MLAVFDEPPWQQQAVPCCATGDRSNAPGRVPTKAAESNTVRVLTPCCTKRYHPVPQPTVRLSSDLGSDETGISPRSRRENEERRHAAVDFDAGDGYDALARAARLNGAGLQQSCPDALDPAVAIRAPICREFSLVASLRELVHGIPFVPGDGADEFGVKVAIRDGFSSSGSRACFNRDPALRSKWNESTTSDSANGGRRAGKFGPLHTGANASRGSGPGAKPESALEIHYIRSGAGRES